MNHCNQIISMKNNDYSMKKQKTYYFKKFKYHNLAKLKFIKNCIEK